MAFDVLAGIDHAKHEGRQYLLGCPGERSLRSTYNALGKLARQTSTDLSHLVIVMMDEYLIATEKGLVFCPQDAHYSCHRFAREEIWNMLNQRRPKEQKVPEHHIWFPNPANPPAYDERLKQAGNIDLFLIASGASDGHVGFNPPGSDLNSRTRVIRLADSTRSDNMRTFSSFTNIDEVPTYGISVGLGTISQLSRKVVLVMHSAQKQHAVQRLTECSDFKANWPASVIFRCRKARVLLDEEAAGDVGVERLQTSFDI